MIKDNQQHFNRLQVVLDGVVVILSYALAWWLKFSSGFVESPPFDCTALPSALLCV